MTTTSPELPQLVHAPFTDATPQMLNDLHEHLAQRGIAIGVSDDIITVRVMLLNGQFLEAAPVVVGDDTYSDVVTRILDAAEDAHATFTRAYAPIP